jgi:phosphoribosylglycinamide formyltransferase-1
MKRLGILASHRGTNFQAIIDACRDGIVNAEPVIAISNNSNSIAMNRARKSGIATKHLSGKTHPDANLLDQAMLDCLITHAVDFVITAGYMKKLGPKTLAHFTGRIINVHPSLLPKYGGRNMYGMNVHRAVIASGDRQTGITIHHVEKDYDTGPVVAQQIVPVLPHDTAETLADRLLSKEHDLLIKTLAKLTS